jgi:hypothetical protein
MVQDGPAMAFVTLVSKNLSQIGLLKPPARLWKKRWLTLFRSKLSAKMRRGSHQ